MKTQTTLDIAVSREYHKLSEEQIRKALVAIKAMEQLESENISLRSLNAELLAALKRMLAIWDGEENEVLDEHGAAFAARQVIAKARKI